MKYLPSIVALLIGGTISIILALKPGDVKVENVIPPIGAFAAWFMYPED